MTLRNVLNHHAGYPVAIMLAVIASLCGPATASPPPEAYTSPYEVHFQWPAAERTKGWDAVPWSDPGSWSRIPWKEWCNPAAYGSKSFANLAYGPRVIQFPSPPGFDAMPPGLKRERVVTAATRFTGLHYQHHHIPPFNPYPSQPGWPWISVRSGLRGPGLDCSNFTSWVYNFALGIRITSDVVRGAVETFAKGPSGEQITISSFNRAPGQSFESFVSSLKPADLLFIGGQGKRAGRVSHVVLWVGAMAADRNGKDRYFIIDSTGEGRPDSAGNRTPDGVYIRAFREDNWYFRNVAVVHRIIRD